MRHSAQSASTTVAIAKALSRAGVVSQASGTFCSPFSPPVTAVHLKAISKAICEAASVSSEK